LARNVGTKWQATNAAKKYFIVIAAKTSNLTQFVIVESLQPCWKHFSFVGIASITRQRSWYAASFPNNGNVRGVLRLLITANVVPRSPIVVTLMMEAVGAIRRNIPEDGILKKIFTLWGSLLSKYTFIVAQVKLSLQEKEQCEVS
jgi:hypothetical protein